MLISIVDSTQNKENFQVKYRNRNQPLNMSQKSQPPRRDSCQRGSLSQPSLHFQDQSEILAHRLPGVQQQLQTTVEKKKPKSRGNRKLQRFRAKLRKQGLNEEAIGRLINDYNHSSQGQDPHQSIPVNTDVVNLINVQDQVSSVVVSFMKLLMIYTYIYLQ